MSNSGTDWSFWGMVGGWAITGIAWVTTWIKSSNQSASDAALARRTDTDLTRRVDDHEARLRVVEAQGSEIAEMRTDIRWIRQTLERQSR